MTFINTKTLPAHISKLRKITLEEVEYVTPRWTMRKLNLETISSLEIIALTHPSGEGSQVEFPYGPAWGRVFHFFQRYLSGMRAVSLCL